MSRKRKGPNRADSGQGPSSEQNTSPLEGNTEGDLVPALTSAWREEALRRWPHRIIEGDGLYAIISAEDPHVRLYSIVDQALYAKRDIHSRIAREKGCMAPFPFYGRCKCTPRYEFVFLGEEGGERDE